MITNERGTEAPNFMSHYCKTLMLILGATQLSTYSHAQNHGGSTEGDSKVTLELNNDSISPNVAANTIQRNLYRVARSVREMSQNTNLSTIQRDQLRDLAEEVDAGLQNPDVLEKLKTSRDLLTTTDSTKVVFDASQKRIEIIDSEGFQNEVKFANINFLRVDALKSFKDANAKAEDNILSQSLDAEEQLNLVTLMLSKSLVPSEPQQKEKPKTQNPEDNFLKTMNDAQNAAQSATSGSYNGSYNAGQFVNASRDILGVPRSGFDLSKNPFYSPTAASEIRSAFSDFAMSAGFGSNDPNYVDESNKLKKLLSTPGFQSLSQKTLGLDQTKDLNLLGAGAAITSDPNVAELGADLAKDYVYKNLSVNQFIKASPVLSSLDDSLGAGTLAQLKKPTLEWLALSGNLAYGKLEEIPILFQKNRELYKKAFGELKIWLETLRALNVLNELDSLILPLDSSRHKKEWDSYQEKLVKRHFASADTLKASKYSQYLEKPIKKLRSVGRWVKTIQPFDTIKLLIWQKSVYQPSELSRAWTSGDPLGITEAKFYYSKLYFQSSLKIFQSDSKESLKKLVEDSQMWASEIRGELKAAQSLKQ